MRVKVEYCMAAASHLGTYEETLEMPLRTALRLWKSSFSSKVFTSSEDTEGNRILEDLLQKNNPRYRYPVSAIISVKMALEAKPGTTDGRDTTSARR